VGRQLNGDHGGASGWAAESQPAVYGLDPLGEPGQAAAGLDAGAAAAIVADPHPQQTGHVDGLQRGLPGAMRWRNARAQLKTSFAPNSVIRTWSDYKINVA
jgi:hypothetical protein